MRMALFSGRYPVDSFLGGIGLRFWELAQVFAEEFEVRVIIPRKSDFKSDKVTLFANTKKEDYEALTWCDIALFSDMPNPSLLLTAHGMNKIIVCDNAVPIEHIYYKEIKKASSPDEMYNLFINIFELQVLVSDIFLVRSSVERATLLASLVLFGRFNYTNFLQSSTLEHMVFNVPIGFNTLSDEHNNKSFPTLSMVDYTWNGGTWDFYDPCSVIRALSCIRNGDNPTTLRFMYPLDESSFLIEANLAIQLISDLNLSQHIRLTDKSVGHYDRDSVLKSTHALITLSKPGIENETCHRFRLRDVFLYELPIIVDKYGETGEYVKKLGIGLAINTEDPDFILYEMRRLLSQETLYNYCLENIRNYRQQVLYNNSLMSVKKRLKDRNRSPDRVLPGLEKRIGSLSDIISSLEDSLAKEGSVISYKIEKQEEIEKRNNNVF